MTGAFSVLTEANSARQMAHSNYIVFEYNHLTGKSYVWSSRGKLFWENEEVERLGCISGKGRQSLKYFILINMIKNTHMYIF